MPLDCHGDPVMVGDLVVPAGLARPSGHRGVVVDVGCRVEGTRVELFVRARDGFFGTRAVIWRVVGHKEFD